LGRGRGEGKVAQRGTEYTRIFYQGDTVFKKNGKEGHGERENHRGNRRRSQRRKG